MSGRGLTWYKRDPIRFLDGVQGMGPEMIGAYAVLLDLIYARDGEITRDDRHLSGILGCGLRKARTLTDELIEAGKVNANGEKLTQKVAKKLTKSQRKVSETRANSQRKRRENEAAAKKNNDLADKTRQTKPPREEKIREDNPLTPLEHLSQVASPGAAKEFCESRREIKKPLTVRAAKAMADKLRNHPNPDGVLMLSVENGWQGIFPDKVGAKSAAKQEATDSWLV